MTTAERVLVVLTVNGPGTIERMARELDVPRREVEAAIQDLRLGGYPVVTSTFGVRLARTADELADCAERLRIRAVHQLLTARALRRTVRAMRAKPAVQAELWREAS